MTVQGFAFAYGCVAVLWGFAFGVACGMTGSLALFTGLFWPLDLLRIIARGGREWWRS